MPEAPVSEDAVPDDDDSDESELHHDDRVDAAVHVGNDGHFPVDEPAERRAVGAPT